MRKRPDGPAKMRGERNGLSGAGPLQAPTLRYVKGPAYSPHPSRWPSGKRTANNSGCCIQRATRPEQAERTAVDACGSLTYAKLSARARRFTAPEDPGGYSGPWVIERPGLPLSCGGLRQDCRWPPPADCFQRAVRPCRPLTTRITSRRTIPASSVLAWSQGCPEQTTSRPAAVAPRDLGRNEVLGLPRAALQDRRRFHPR